MAGSADICRILDGLFLFVRFWPHTGLLFMQMFWFVNGANPGLIQWSAIFIKAFRKFCIYDQLAVYQQSQCIYFEYVYSLGPFGIGVFVFVFPSQSIVGKFLFRILCFLCAKCLSRSGTQYVHVLRSNMLKQLSIYQ